MDPPLRRDVKKPILKYHALSNELETFLRIGSICYQDHVRMSAATTVVLCIIDLFRGPSSGFASEHRSMSDPSSLRFALSLALEAYPP